jgi:hypothetical protein
VICPVEKEEIPKGGVSFDISKRVGDVLGNRTFVHVSALSAANRPAAAEL